MKSFLPKEAAKEIARLTGREVPDPNHDDYDAMIAQLRASGNAEHQRAAMLMESKVKLGGQDPREQLERRTKWGGSVRKFKRAAFLAYDAVEDDWVFSRGKLIGWVALLGALGFAWMFASFRPLTAFAESQPNQALLIQGESGGAALEVAAAAPLLSGSAAGAEAANPQTEAAPRDAKETTGDPFVGFTGSAGAVSGQLLGAPTLPVTTQAATSSGAAATTPDGTDAPQSATAKPRLTPLNVTPGQRRARLHASVSAPQPARSLASSPVRTPSTTRLTAGAGRAGPRATFSNQERSSRRPALTFATVGTQTDSFNPPSATTPDESSEGTADEAVAGGVTPTNPYDPASVRAAPPAAPAPSYAVGDSIKATLEVGPVIVEGDGGGQSSLGSNQVVARDEHGTAWVGEAVLQRSGRMTVSFSAAIDGNGERSVQAIALDKDAFAGLPATFQETSPALASDLARGALRGVSDYVDDLRSSGTAAFRGNTTTVTDTVAPLETSILGSVAELFTPPSTTQQALIRVATLAPGTEFLLKVLQ